MLTIVEGRNVGTLAFETGHAGNRNDGFYPMKSRIFGTLCRRLGTKKGLHRSYRYSLFAFKGGL